MIGSKIKRHFIRKKLSKLIAEYQLRSSESRNGKIRTIGVLTTHKVYTEFNLRGLVSDTFGTEDIRICSFTTPDKNQEKSPECFSESDLNWRGDVKEPSLSLFRDESFDLLICLYSMPHTILDFIACTSKASFKVGLAAKNAKFFDLEVHLETNEVQGFLDEMKKYLQILQKV